MPTPTHARTLFAATPERPRSNPFASIDINEKSAIAKPSRHRGARLTLYHMLPL